MALLVQKFGGATVATFDHMKEVAKKIKAAKEAGNDLVIVVSAMGDQTDDFLDAVEKLCPNDPPKREVDMLLVTGEQQSIAYLALALHGLGCPAMSFTGAQLGIRTTPVFGNSRIEDISGVDKLRKALDAGNVVVVAGFQGASVDGENTTLGRGGSDLTAVALAAALKADMCEFYKDVDGVFTTDPRVCKDARKMDQITYDEMLELASMGAGVLYSRSVEFAKKYGVPMHVRSCFHDKPGTLVVEEADDMEKVLVRGVAFSRAEAKITILGVPDQPGVAAAVFEALGAAGIIVDMIVQNVSQEGHTDISFTISRKEYKKALDLAKKVCVELKAKSVVGDDQMAKISVVGVGMKSHAGVAAKMFQALAQAKINIEMISTSEIKISVITRESDLEKAVQVIHAAFGLGASPAA